MTDTAIKRLGPWQQLRCREVYNNPWLRLEHHDVLTPAGTAGIYGKICFHNIAVGVIPVDADGHTYLVGQYRYPLEAYSWEIPEGGCPRGTSTAETAHRELAEETGLRARCLYRLMTLHTSNSVSDEVAEVYLAMDLEQGEADTEETEDIEVQRIPLGQAIDRALAGDISDAISVAALLKLRVLLSAADGDMDAMLAGLTSV